MADKYQIHVSGLLTLARCGEQYRRRYIEREIRPPGVSLIVGSTVHDAVAYDLKNHINEGKLLPDELVETVAAEGLGSRWERGVTLDPDEAAAGADRIRGEAIDKSVRLARLHHEKVAPSIEPSHVERHWTLDLAGYDFQLAGAIDIQEGAAAIRDTKTSKKTPSKNPADRSIQLTAYALAVQVSDGALPEVASLDYLIDLKRERKAKRYETQIEREDFDPFLERVANWHRAIEAGVFTPAHPDDWCCSRKYCGYFDSCRYVRRPATTGGLVAIEPANDLPGDRLPPGESTHPPNAQQPTPAPGGSGRAAGDERPNSTQGVADAVADSAGSASSPSEPDAPTADFSTTNEAAKSKAARKSNPQPPAKPVAPRPQIPGAALLW